jgi:hypothetical protein
MQITHLPGINDSTAILIRQRQIIADLQGANRLLQRCLNMVG